MIAGNLTFIVNVGYESSDRDALEGFIQDLTERLSRLPDRGRTLSSHRTTVVAVVARCAMPMNGEEFVSKWTK